MALKGIKPKIIKTRKLRTMLSGKAGNAKTYWLHEDNLLKVYARTFHKMCAGGKVC
jgi:hypothetical protein